MASRYKNITFFIFLLLILLVPYGFRIIDYRMEIFPSVVLPLVAGKARVNDEVRRKSYEIYGFTKEGELKNLDKSRFLKHIRVGYFDFFYEDRFGLRKFNGHQFKTNRLNIPIVLAPKVSEEDKKATKKWLRARLREQDCNDSVLILKKKWIVIPKNGTYYKDKIIEHDTILDLY